MQAKKRDIDILKLILNQQYQGVSAPLAIPTWRNKPP